MGEIPRIARIRCVIAPHWLDHLGTGRDLQVREVRLNPGNALAGGEPYSFSSGSPWPSMFMYHIAQPPSGSFKAV
jgi:hypothetical protein